MRILFFAHLKNVAGRQRLEWHGPPLSPDEFWRMLLQEHPELGPFKATVRLARNGEYVRENTLFLDDDEIALIPPVSGG